MQREGDPLETHLGHGGAVAIEHHSVFGALCQVRTLGNGPGQFVDEEVELGVVRLLAPEGAVVVEHGHSVGRRDLGRGIEERNQSVAGRPRPPGGEQRVRHRRPPF